ncbi:sphingomyelin phosphodiesterase, putative, partial [Ixodes scapularis]
QVMSEASIGVVSPKACDVCNSVAKMLLDYLNSGKSIQALIKLLQGVCAFFKLAGPETCNGAIDLYKDEVIYIMRNLKAPPHELCTVVMGSSCGPLASPVHNWTVPLNGRPKPAVDARTGRGLTRHLRVLHVSDTHYDPEYEPGSNGDCPEPMCCRGANGKAPSDETKAGKWGYLGKCDIPLRTLESMLQHASQNHKASGARIDMILWTGDLPPHDPWKATKEETISNLRVTSQLIRKYFPTATVLPAIGNHEAVPINSFPVPNKGNYTVQWLYDEFANHWMDFLPQSTKPTIKRGAFYSIQAGKGLRVISLNTNLCYIYNWWLLYNSTDPKGQLHWLVDELQRAEDAGDKVFIMGHVAPVHLECITAWANSFRRIANRYESTIVAHFYGHTHFDHFHLFYDEKDESRPTGVAYMGPSVTTFVETNPSYRVYTVDGVGDKPSWEVVDHETYWMDLAATNRDDKPRWALQYAAKKHYGLKSLSPRHWHELAERFNKDDNLFQDYYR